jgi:hypothetical protein
MDIGAFITFCILQGANKSSSMLSIYLEIETQSIVYTLQ